MKRPVLYSFRRCPYAMRARMALMASGEQVGLREIVLRDKPQEMVEASPKATVPVLVLADGTVLDQSLDIALWALGRKDPQGWLPADDDQRKAMLDFIDEMDGPFKHHLDRAKYSTRYVEDSEDAQAVAQFEAHHRQAALEILKSLERRLSQSAYLFGSQPSFADVSTFPFIRQFANSDRDWWAAQALPHLQNWLTTWLESPLFEAIMEKYRPWKETAKEIAFP